MPFLFVPPPPVEIPKSHFEFMELQVSNGLQKIDDGLLNFKLDEDTIKQSYLREKFKSLSASWQKNTKYSSSVLTFIEDENFKKIVSMGEAALPLILIELEKKPSALVWALNMITGKSVSDGRRVTIAEASKLWVKWGKRVGIIV